MESFDGNTTGQMVVAAFATDVAAKAIIITGASKVDLASNESVRHAAVKINALPDLDHIDIVINAAGNMAVRTYQASADGFELQFAANHLGHFLLTKLILDKILAASAPTVVNLTSMGYELAECNFEDPNFNAGRVHGNAYDPWLAYSQAKTANILHVLGLYDKFGHKGLATFAVHPGYVSESQLECNNGVDTDLMIAGYKLAVARNDDKSSTLLFEEKVHPSIKEYATNKQNAKKLWDLSEKLGDRSMHATLNSTCEELRITFRELVNIVSSIPSDVPHL
ncbi:putative short-chain dehydrogenase [Xylariaceae sp. FL1651]|nr:putative short-chain dehydrogenase [Xylariaceae sp. FL1651]